jgi:DNA-binding protein H-NS
MTDFKNLSEVELQDVIANAENALKEKKNSKRKVVIAQINDLAASIGVQIEIIGNDKRSARKGIKVPVKYKNPANPNEKWTGRGVTPKWLRAYLDEGRDKSEFEV